MCIMCLLFPGLMLSTGFFGGILLNDMYPKNNNTNNTNNKMIYWV